MEINAKDLDQQFSIFLRLLMKLTFPSGDLVPGIPGVVFRQNVGRNSLQHFLGEDTEQLPADVQRFEDCAVFVPSLSDEVLLKLSKELQIEQIIGRESFLSDDGLHGLDVLADSVASVQLVGDVRVILSGHALADGRLHETR
jgi:hypothetical protein